MTSTSLTRAAATGSPARNLPSALAVALARYPSSAVRSLRPGGPAVVTYAELARAAREIAKGLADLGIRVGDRVAILSDTRLEWTLADLGVLFAGATVVPIYHTSSPEECAYVLAHSDARAVLCEDAAQLAKVDRVRDRCSQLEHCIVLTGEAPGALALDALRERGRAHDDALLAQRLDAVGPDDVATLVYTSGTTGPPKGCMLTHANVVAAIDMYRERLELGADISVFMFLPLAHVLARVTQMVALVVGATIIFWGGELQRIVAELAEARPTHFPSVPRVYEKLYAAIVGGVEEQRRVRRWVFAWALAQGRRVRERQRRGVGVGALLGARQRLADRLVLSKVRAAFGGELRLALSGAAPIAPEVLEFFHACGVLIVEGYGLTETCAAATLNTPREHRFGTVGRPLPGTDVRVAADGELLTRGPNVFAGYHKDPDATAQTFEGGWLRTGDLGAVDADGFVRITGRKKELIITSSGKNISPANIEELLRQTRWISQAVVYGDNRPYLVALVTLDADQAPKLAARVGAAPDIPAMARDERVRAELQASIDAVNTRLARIEQIKRFAILDHDLSQAAGELTPTLKIKRPIVCDRFRDVFEGLYAP